MAAKKTTKQVVKKSQVNQIRELNDADIQAKIAELKQEQSNDDFYLNIQRVQKVGQELRLLEQKIEKVN